MSSWNRRNTERRIPALNSRQLELFEWVITCASKVAILDTAIRNVLSTNYPNKLQLSFCEVVVLFCTAKQYVQDVAQDKAFLISFMTYFTSKLNTS